MGRRTKRSREVARLRREVEILKAQLAGEPAGERAAKEKAPPPARESLSPTVEFSDAAFRPNPHLKRDLLKTFLLTGVSLAVILGLYLTRDQWPTVYKRAAEAAGRLRF